MADTPKIDWSGSIEIKDESYPKDVLNRAKYAEFLTSFLASQGYDASREEGKEKRNYVLNLNSEWGSGKSYFLKRWSEDLKVHYPVVYIDAWQQDYSDDPLMTVISSMVSQLRELAGDSEDKTSIKVTQKAIGLLKAAGPGIVKSFSKRYLGIDAFEVMNAEGETGKTVKSEDEDEDELDMSEAASAIVNHLIDEHSSKQKAVDALKQDIKNWVAKVNKVKTLSYPAFIFIDELDRCRPNYAVEMLETIKHIFDIEGLVFVVATDTEQLQHAVKVIYGSGFEANRYLGRFFNSRFTLKTPDLSSFLEVHVEYEKLDTSSLDERGLNVIPYVSDGLMALRNISKLIGAFNLPPRTAIQIAERVVATITHAKAGSNIDLIALTTLHILREKDLSLYRDIVNKSYKRKNEKNNNIELETLIEEMISPINLSLDLFFSPLKKLNMDRYFKRYKEGTYRIDFIEYIKTVFKVKMSIDNPTFIGGMDLNGRSNSRKDPYHEKLMQISQGNYGFEKGELWMEFIEMQRVSSSSRKIDQASYYKDLVELSSSLEVYEE